MRHKSTIRRQLNLFHKFHMALTYPCSTHFIGNPELLNHVHVLKHPDGCSARVPGIQFHVIKLMAETNRWRSAENKMHLHIVCFSRECQSSDMI